jgi:hypothetical protein
VLKIKFPESIRNVSMAIRNALPFPKKASIIGCAPFK